MADSNSLTLPAQTMTSREIAALTNKRHDHVLRDIDSMLQNAPDMGTSIKSSTYVNANGVWCRCLLLDKEASLVVVSGYNLEMRRRIIRRWQELEKEVAQNTIALPQTYKEALVALVAEVEKTEKLEKQIAIAAPKIEFADALLNAEGTTLVRDVAKTLGVPVRQLQSALRTKGVILANNAPAAVYVAKGYFKEETHSFETKTRGTQIGHTARVTGLGIEFIRRFVQRHAGLFARALH